MNTTNASQLSVYLTHYSKQEEIPRYISKTAGAGIGYVLNHLYAPVYERLLKSRLAACSEGHRLQILEYGCGGGMNLIKMIEILRSLGADLERAYGTDFAQPMIEAATRESQQYLPPELIPG